MLLNVSLIVNICRRKSGGAVTVKFCERRIFYRPRAQVQPSLKIYFWIRDSQLQMTLSTGASGLRRIDPFSARIAILQVIEDVFELDPSNP